HDPQSTNLQLHIAQRGVLDNLQWQPLARRAPQQGEVEIEVRATGLNFRDVLNALGMYPGDPGALGAECSGVIVAVGEGVHDYKIGDEVLALAGACFASYVTTRVEFVAHKPRTCDFAQAATIPVTFLTTYYGLQHLAKLKRGERVLIHAAAGGVGSAAVQLAQRMGAEVFATASASKWEFLKSLGVQHVMNSRTLDFADAVMAVTNNEGVHVVLNSLAGDFIPKSIGVLARGGRFLEIGKRDIWSDEKVAAVRPDVSNFIYDLAALMNDDPALIQTMLRDVMVMFADGALQPLPVKTFASNEAVSAFRYMAGAKHVGKVVVVPKIEASGSRIVDRRSSSHSNNEATIHEPLATIPELQSTILITGGFGALGLRVAEWLVKKGARHLLLAGRNAPKAEALAAIHKLEQAGAKIGVALGDVANELEAAFILDHIAQHNLPPLQGIVHAAGVLDDGVLVQQTWPRFAKVLAPKLKGAWNLHVLTQDAPLDFFVLFSSIASVFNSPGQSNYAAANAFLDALAHYRRASGLPALSLNWGPWAEAGMAAEQQQRRANSGLDAIAPEQGLHALELALQKNLAQIIVAPIQWQKLLRGEAVPRLFAAMQETTSQAAYAEGATTASLLQTLQAASPKARYELLLSELHALALKTLALPAGEVIDPQKPFSAMGLDSLMAVELRNALNQALGLSLPASLLFDYPSLASLAEFLFKKELKLNGEEQAAVIDKEEEQRAQMIDEIKHLSEAEVEASLAAELGQLLK
ncbi:SDR family NAD(P)-dependent oxidoreductase, partial [candidate division KSB1 bacterium]|nr:SDR family NAD(P)-dependent oxidoreductase [candidate division KSB1 bacterium]